MATVIQLIEEQPTVRRQEINLKWPERYLSVITGVKVGLSGIKHLFSNPFSSIIKKGAGGYLLNRGITGHCELYDIAGKTSTQPMNATISTSVSVNSPRMEVYDFWRKLDNLPLFMNHLKSVELMDENQSHWTLKLPVDIAEVSWDAEIIYDEPGNMIAWKSVPGSMIINSGKVRFIDTSDHETLIHVSITYQPPAGGVGAGIAHLLNPLFRKLVKDDILNFKHYMEVGHVADI
jgi:uncharacterized membrane protein